MTDKEMNRAIQVLGPKVINSIMRMSQNQLDVFNTKITELIESKRDKTKEWYRPGVWIDI